MPAPEPGPVPEPEISEQPSAAVLETLGVNEFEHERLDVYQAAIQFLVGADAIAASLPRGRGYLADQLRRAASSILFNIAEGAGEFASDEKARFYRIARRSATEAAAILDACRALELIRNETPQACRVVLLRVVAMLTALAKRSGAGTGPGSGSG